jgi:hypothetical protein
MIHKHRTLHFPALLVACVLVSPALHAQGSAIDEASQTQIDTARAAYERGLEAMDGEKYSEALEQFRKSYTLVNSPNSQLMVGRALAKLGRLPQAYTELRHALQQANELSATQKKYQKTAASAQKDLDDIKDKLSYVVMPQGATAKIQGQSVGPFKEDEPIAVVPGAVSIEVTRADGTTETKHILLSPGEKIDLPSQTPTATGKTKSRTQDEKPTRDAGTSHDGDLGMSRKTLGYIVGGVGVFGVATFVGVGLLGASVYGNPIEDCSQHRCPEASLQNEGRKSVFQGIGYAGLTMGVIGLGIGTWLVLGADDKAKTTTALQFGPGAVQVNHRF